MNSKYSNINHLIVWHILNIEWLWKSSMRKVRDSIIRIYAREVRIIRENENVIYFFFFNTPPSKVMMMVMVVLMMMVMLMVKTLWRRYDVDGSQNSQERKTQKWNGKTIKVWNDYFLKCKILIVILRIFVPFHSVAYFVLKILKP